MDSTATVPATVQAVLSRFLDNAGLDTQRRKVCAHLLACRTEAMGETRFRCEACAHEQRRYHGCRDRHCPQCQGRATRLWVERQALLPVAYHHLVFTLPHTLNGWVQLHPEVIYRLLFQCAWATLKAFGEDPKRLNGQLGMTAVLHRSCASCARGISASMHVTPGAKTSANTFTCTPWYRAAPWTHKGNGSPPRATTCSRSKRSRATSGAAWSAP